MDMIKVKNINYRLLLQNEFIQRCREDSAYSIRTFAKNLGVNPGTLSQMLKGKRKISDNYKDKFLKALSLNPEIYLKFEEKSENEMSFEEKKFEELSMDIFNYISDWYYDAILNLINTKDFRFDLKWISKRINININKTTIAVERLKRLGLIKENKDGSWSRTYENTTMSKGDFTTAAKKNLQKQLLEKAIKALYEVPYSDRSQSSMVLPIKKDKLPLAEEIIKKFRREISAIIHTNKEDADSVYQLVVSFYPLTIQNEKENEDEKS